MELKVTSPALTKWMGIPRGVKVLSEKARNDDNFPVLNKDLSMLNRHIDSNMIFNPPPEIVHKCNSVNRNEPLKC